MDRKSLRSFLLSVFFVAVFNLSAHASIFNIDINFMSVFTPSQETIFLSAESYWEGVLTGYQPDISISSLTIRTQSSDIDGVGGILGSAGPTFLTLQGGFTLARRGVMSFDIADLDDLESNGKLYDVVLHEMAHVIGFGTLWEDNGVYTDGSGQYTGASALAAYQIEFDPMATYVPVELGGGDGTADGHWDEINGGSAATGITDTLGNDMQNELMTGWLNSPIFVSTTTLMSFEDIGYVVLPVPIPGSLLLLGTGVLSRLGIKRRQKRMLQ